jgi:hypothetical protein
LDLFDREEWDDPGETWDEFVFVNDVISEVEMEASSLSNQEGEPDGLDSLLNEKRKGWTAGGSFLRMRFVTGFCSYTQSDPPSRLAHGVQGFFASHLCS